MSSSGIVEIDDVIGHGCRELDVGHPLLSIEQLEGLNSKIRLVNHRGYGHHSAAAVIAMVYLCCGGLTIDLPTTTFV